MPFRERLRHLVRSFSIEVLSLWFVFLDRRVRWYTRVILVLPIAYVVSPVDLIRDTLLLWGQIDDLVVLRTSHYLFTKFVDPAILADSRQQAAAFLDVGRRNRVVFWLSIAAVWGITILLVLQWLVKRFVRAA